MKNYVIAVIKEDKRVIGYRLFIPETGGGTLKDISLQQLQKVCSGGYNGFFNASYSKETNDLVGIQGSMNSLPVLSKNLVVEGRAGLTVIYSVVDDKNTIQGYGVVDTYGMSVPISKKKLIDISSRYRMTNYEVYSLKDGSLSVRPKSGSFPAVKMTKAVEVNTYNSKTDSEDSVNRIKSENNGKKNDIIIKQIRQELSSKITSSGSEHLLPGIEVFNLADISTNEFNISSQEKKMLTNSNLNKVSPYYGMLYSTIKQVPCTAIPTMGVTEDTLFYNPEFLATMRVDELTFVNIHEMLHIAMQHSIRHGSRDNELWNTATDLYINEIICRDFGVKFGGESKIFDNGSSLKTPNFGVFLSTIGESLDFGVDTPESIYNMLVKENKQDDTKQGNGNGTPQSDKGSQQNSNDKSDSQNSNGDSQGNKSDSQGEKSDSKDNKSNSDSQGDKNDSQGGKNDSQGDKNDSQDGNEQSNGKSDKPQGDKDDDTSDDGTNPFQSEGSSVNQSDKSSLNDDSTDSDNADYTARQVPFDVIFRGKHLKGLVSRDILTNHPDATNVDTRKIQVDESKSALKRIEVKKEIMKQDGKTFSLTSSAEMCERYINFGLSMSYSWEQILRNKAKVEHKKMYTLGSLNEVYSNMGMTLATRRKVGKPSKLGGLKICIDVSGSVSQTEIDSIYTKVSMILNKFDVEAELIFWDTSVTNVGNFSDIKDLIKIKPLGGGGTNVNCLFDYLVGKTKCRGITQKTRVRDMSAVLIFTDGCFGKINNSDLLAKYFSNKAIWVVNDGCVPFIPEFGILAPRDSSK